MGLYVSFEYRITALKSFELNIQRRQTKAKLHDSEGSVILTEPSSTHYRQENSW